MVQHIRLLGGVAIESPDRIGPPSLSRKAQALLGYLVRRPQPVARTHLTGLLWGEASDTRGRRNLTRELGHLTAMLPGCILSDYYTVYWQPTGAAWVDVVAFAALLVPPTVGARLTHMDHQAASDDWFSRYAPTRIDAAGLAQAVALYQGEFMADLYLDDSPEFESWLLQEREIWRHQMTIALDQLVGFHALRHEDDLAQSYARHRLALEPTHEEAHRALMVLLARNGQRTAALAQYTACRRILSAELDVEPAPATTALYQQIRAGTLERVAGAPAEWEHASKTRR